MSKIVREIQEEVNELVERYGKNELSYEKRREMMHDRIVEEVSKLTQELVDGFNGSYSDDVIDGMLDGIVRSHRYLQGEFWMGMRKLIDKYSQLDENRYFDGRNQFARVMCERMKKGVDTL